MSTAPGSRVRWSGWKPGPDATTPGEVFVSVTRFHACRMIDLPRIAWDAYSLRRRWHELSGGGRGLAVARLARPALRVGLGLAQRARHARVRALGAARQDRQALPKPGTVDHDQLDNGRIRP